MLVITGICYVLALLRYRLFGVGLVARSTIVENILDLVVVFDTRDHIVDFNAAAAAAFGLDRKKTIGEKPPALPAPFADFFCSYTGVTTLAKEVSLDLSGTSRVFDLTISPLTDAKNRSHGRLFLLHDISDLKAAQETVKRLLEEKELLLQEVHHRIKNNMSTMSSILSLHADALSDPAAKAALMDARSRMQSMMVLYSKLYIAPAIGALNAEFYLSPLIEKIHGTFENAGKVTLSRRFGDFDLDGRTLFSVGLIVNELLTNAMKYAFEGRESGSITVSMGIDGADVVLDVVDDGVGFPDAADPRVSGGFGLGLVRILLTQLRGAMTVDRERGTRFRLRFPYPACRSGK
jgi:PAS domain S-box-containing protein